MKYLILLSLLTIGTFRGLSQTTDTNSAQPADAPGEKITSSNNYPWVIKIDLTRLLPPIPSFQLSVAKRQSQNWGFESELNYYINYHNPKVPERILDPLLVNLNQSKINFLVSGIAKRYVGKKENNFYIGVRGAIGAANLQLERNVCTETAPSGEVCRCLKFETRQLDVKRSIRIFGMRFGFDDIPISKRLKLDTYIDLAGFSSKSNTTYERLQHQSSCTQDIAYIWRNIYYPKLTPAPIKDGILHDFNKKNSKLLFSFGLKFGYAF